MIRCLAVVASCFTALAGLVCAPTAVASPSGGGGGPSCVYTLSTPALVQVSNTTMVTVTLTPYPCTGSINPNYLNVCLKPAADPSAGKCGFSAVPDHAEVFVPYKPGTTYIASGTGCGSVYTTQGSICETVGPRNTTL
jgi:hypothetical protein